MLSPFSCPSVEHHRSLQTQPGATVPPTAREEGVSLFAPSLLACYIRYEELTHNAFVQTQIEQQFYLKRDIKSKEAQQTPHALH